MTRPFRTAPLKALKTFDAAARHLNFTDAAKELGVTAPAVGMQIRRLEDRIGRSLFIRENRSVSLSPAGAWLAPKLAALLSEFDHLLTELAEPSTATLDDWREDE